MLDGGGGGPLMPPSGEAVGTVLRLIAVVSAAVAAALMVAAPAANANGKYANCTEAHRDGELRHPAGRSGLLARWRSRQRRLRVRQLIASGITVQMVKATIIGVALSASAFGGAPIADAAPYSSCAAAEVAGAAPLYAGQPGYSTKLDRDGDGVACESGSGSNGGSVAAPVYSDATAGICTSTGTSPEQQRFGTNHATHLPAVRAAGRNRRH